MTTGCFVDGTQEQADLTVVSTGVRPRTDLVAAVALRRRRVPRC